MVNKTEINTGDQQVLDFSHLAESPLETDIAPVLDLDMEICGAIKGSISASFRSRPQIVDRMNYCLVDTEFDVTPRQLNQWLAPSQGDKRFPAWAIPAMCWATRSILPLQRMAHALGYELVDRRDQQALHYGQALIKEQQAKREASELKKQMGMGKGQ
jgi:hypothetical protein